jgi:hypothetical protein
MSAEVFLMISFSRYVGIDNGLTRDLYGVVN